MLYPGMPPDVVMSAVDIPRRSGHSPDSGVLLEEQDGVQDVQSIISEPGAAKPQELLSSFQTLPQHTETLGQGFYLPTGNKPPGFEGGDVIQLYYLSYLLTICQICWTRSKGIETASI